MSSPNPPPSPLAEALANEDIAFSSPEALRALPFNSAWPPRPPTEVFSRPRKEMAEEHRSKLLPGEKDPQPAFRLPTASTPSEVLSPSKNDLAAAAGSEQLSPPSQRHESPEDPGPSRRHDASALRSPTKESSRVVAGPSRRHNAAVEKSTQLPRASRSQQKQADGMGVGSHGQSTAQGRGVAQLDAQEDIQPELDKGKGESKQSIESTAPEPDNDLRPLHRRLSWSVSHPPSSPSSSGSWVTARGEEVQEADEEEEEIKKKRGVKWGERRCERGEWEVGPRPREEVNEGREERNDGREVGEEILEAPKGLLKVVERRTTA